MMYQWVLLAGFYLLAVYVYFWLAKKFNIVDVPNHRTLHVKPVFRGGGIIFPIGVLLYTILFADFQPLAFLAGLIMIATISFIDDLGHISPALRVLCQFLAVTLLVWQVGVFSWGWGLTVVIIIIAVGIVNAYNFMDGINGLTGGYSILVLLSLMYIQYFMLPFTSENLLWSILIGLVVFNFLNFRNKARCFAGDVGSVSIAFILIYLIMQLIFATENPLYILLLTVYGMDSIFTIVHRLIKKENIFEAHRQHLFQLLVYYKGVSHVNMSIIYVLIQGGINVSLLFILSFLPVHFQYGFCLLILLMLSALYFFIKGKLIKLT